MFRCRHLETNSDRLFKSVRWSACKMASFSASVFNLINKHFPAHHKLHKICNKFNVKLSYSCMPNMMSIINNHNKKLLHPHTDDKDLPCNCRNLHDCPLMESAKQNPSFTKHPSVLPTHRPNTILAAAKLNSRPVFIITDNPSITETKQTPQNSPKQYRNIKIKESNRE